MSSVNEDNDDTGWSHEGAKWFNSLSIEEIVDIKMLQDYGVEDEEDQEKLERLRKSYETATGSTWDLPE
jgi:hypothetical protein